MRWSNCSPCLWEARAVLEQSPLLSPPLSTRMRQQRGGRDQGRRGGRRQDTAVTVCAASSLSPHTAFPASGSRAPSSSLST